MVAPPPRLLADRTSPRPLPPSWPTVAAERGRNRKTPTGAGPMGVEAACMALRHACLKLDEPGNQDSIPDGKSTGVSEDGSAASHSLCFTRLHVRSRERNSGRWRGYGGLRAWRRPAGCNSDGAARARGGVLTMSTGRSEMAGHVQPRTTGAVAGCGGGPHRGAGDGGAGPMGRQHRSRPANPADPLMMRAGETPMPIARNRSRFIEIAIHLRQSRPDNPRPETAPSFSTDGYLAENL